jgi:3-methyladenine DNA glycosylase/8-oxoguanine DNA glycosylase
MDCDHGLGCCSPPVKLSLSYLPPLRWDDLLNFLRKRAVKGVEAVTDHTYSRSFSLGGTKGVFEVKPSRRGCHSLDVSLYGAGPASIKSVERRVRAMFDLDADPAAIASHLCRDRRLASLVRDAPGMRIPRTWDPFEAIVRAVLGQQISLVGAITIAGRLVERFGRHLKGGGAITRMFPGPSDIMNADLSGIGIPSSRVRSLSAVSQALLDRRLRLNGSTAGKRLEDLMAIPGIGPWSANYVALRGLGESDAFPESDLAIRKALDVLGYSKDRTTRRRQIERLSPWRGYAAIYFWYAMAARG